MSNEVYVADCRSIWLAFPQFGEQEVWTLGSNRNPLTREEVLAAAIDCIERYGITKTSMTDVGKVLGVTRQTVHRIFETRSELFAAVAELRIEKLARQLATKFKKFDCLKDALIEGSLLSITAGQGDAVLNDILEGGDHAVDQFMFRGSPIVQRSMMSVWEPLIEDARAKGQLRPTLDNEACIEWIRNIHAMMTLRNDYDENKRRFLFATFLVPAILVQ